MKQTLSVQVLGSSMKQYTLLFKIAKILQKFSDAKKKVDKKLSDSV